MIDDVNYIKIDGEPDSFEGGAIRYSKKGKGRYDLIPEEAFYLLLAFADFEYGEQPAIWVSTSDILKSAYTPGPDRYVRTLFDFILYEYCTFVKDEPVREGKVVTYKDWIHGLNNAIKDLAIHYEFGAEKYGVDNWKKGILRTGGDRGGSFTDSGLRHLNQYIAGETDEKHGVSFMWNFVNAIYLQTIENGEEEIKKAYHEKKNIKEVIGDAEPYEFKE